MFSSENKPNLGRSGVKNLKIMLIQEELVTRAEGDGSVVKDGSVIRSTYCSYRGPGFSSKYPHEDSQLFVTQVLGDNTLSDLLRHMNVHVHIHRHAGKKNNSHTYKK